ncbi:MAG: DegT/DnrJ/EryC1/StrS family aminotransferase [Chloroflexi bacterium]|nr:DegT/DnrJ/EryC1/StrS family aminotransferase [Chloroflexota bacterium]
MGIPLVDLRAQYRAIQAEIDAAMRAVIEESAFIKGPHVARFEAELAAYCGARHAIGVASGTDALALALRAVGIGPGDEVLTVPNTFTATAEAIVHVGASVRFVDVDPATANLDVSQVERALTPRTAAVLPVHLYGQPVDLDPLLQVAAAHNLVVVEDAAQAIGARYRGRPAGTIGHVGCFSFYPGKNLGAYGDGGAVVTNDETIARRVRSLADHGRLSKYEHDEVGYSSRLDGLQAAILSAKLRHLDGWNARRRAHAAAYDRLLAGTPGLETPAVAPDVEPIYHLYVVESDRRDVLAERLAAKGIATGIHYPMPLHLQPAYRHLGLPPGSFPATERRAGRILSLPMYPELTDEQVIFIAEAVRDAARA